MNSQRTTLWRSTSACAVLTLFLLLPAAAGAALNKCQDASGRVTYTDKPCAAGESASPQAPAPIPPAPPASRAEPQGAQPRIDKTATPYRRPQRVEVPPLPKLDLSGLPKDEQGRPVLGRSGNSSLVLDNKGGLSPVNVLAACSVLVTRCVKAGERDLDACFMSVPRCAADRPWEDKDYKPCCPTVCWNRYEARRIAGASPISAFDDTLFGGGVASNGCIVGK